YGKEPTAKGVLRSATSPARKQPRKQQPRKQRCVQDETLSVGCAWSWACRRASPLLFLVLRVRPAFAAKHSERVFDRRRDGRSMHTMRPPRAVSIAACCRWESGSSRYLG